MQRAYRLKNSRSFEVIYKRGKSVSEGCLTLISLAGKFPTIKVGIVAGKKVGNSVSRNKVKRRLREAFRLQLPRVKTGYSYIAVAKAGATEYDYSGLYALLERLLTASDRIK